MAIFNSLVYQRVHGFQVTPVALANRNFWQTSQGKPWQAGSVDNLDMLS